MQTEPTRETVDLRTYARLLWRRKWIVLVPTVLALATAFVVTLPKYMEPLYQSSATLLMEPPPQMRQLSALIALPSAEQRIGELETQIRSTDFLVAVGRNIGLRDAESVDLWARKNLERYPGLSREELMDQRVADLLRRKVNLQRRGQGATIELSGVMSSAVQARDLAQQLTEGVLKAARSREVASVSQAERFTRNKLAEYEDSLALAESRLERTLRASKIEELGSGAEYEGRIFQARQLRQHAEDERAARSASVEDAAARLGGAEVRLSELDRILSRPEVRRLLEEARDAERSYVRLTLFDGRDAATTQASAVGIARTAASIEEEVRGVLDGWNLSGAHYAAAVEYLIEGVRRDLAQSRRIAYDAQIAEVERRRGGQPQDEIATGRLRAEVGRLRQIRDTFESQLLSSTLGQDLDQSDLSWRVSVLQQANLPEKPFKPKRGQILLLSVMAGLAIGIGGAFFLEHHDPSYRDPKDLERDLGLRVVGTTPAIHEIGKLQVEGRGRAEGPLQAAAAERAVRSYLADSAGYQEFRKLVLSLVGQDGTGPRSVLLTSARRGEGKSTASLCLALAFAKEFPQERVVLVDLDTRMAALGAVFGLNGDSGRPQVSIRRKDWAGDPFVRLPLPNLRLLTIGHGEENLGDLVNVENIRWLLKELSLHADRIIIDAPPNLAVPDALVIGPQVDAVLVVVGAGSTPRETVRRGVDLQRQFRDNIAGVVMNNQAEVLPYYYSPKHYGYGYGYGKKRRDTA